VLEEYQEVIDSFFEEIISNVPNGSKWLLLCVNSYLEFGNILDYKVTCDGYEIEGVSPELCIELTPDSKTKIIKTFLSSSIHSNIIHQAIAFERKVIFVSYDAMQNNAVASTIVNKLKRLSDYQKVGLLSEVL
jgi:hypothetical protein